jgi:N6-adenosine-specific RNA methylase IME4
MTAEWPFDHLRMFGYDLLMVDPPTEFELYSDKGAAKSAAAHYDLMEWDAIAALPVGQLARRDCLLVLWACAPTLPRSLDLLRAWGFTYKTEVIWAKVTKNGKPAMGPGYIARTLHEPIIIATTGEPKLAHAFRSLIPGVRRRHSEKPEEIYRECERVMPGAFRADLFSRKTRPGWDVWGDQVGLLDDPAAKVPTKKPKRSPAPAGPMPLFDE